MSSTQKNILTLIVVFVAVGFGCMLLGVIGSALYFSQEREMRSVSKAATPTMRSVNFGNRSEDTSAADVAVAVNDPTATATSMPIATPTPRNTPTPVDPCGIQAIATYMDESIDSLSLFVAEREKIAPGEVSPPRIRPPLLEMKKVRKNADDIFVPQCEQTEEHYQLLIMYMDYSIKAQESAIVFDIDTASIAQMEANQTFDQIYEATYLLKEAVEDMAK